MPVVKLDITQRQPFAAGESFDPAGPYEFLQGTAQFAVDPAHPRNTAITDMDLAPRQADGTVAFSADFAMLQPADAGRGNRRMFFDVMNRGRKTVMPRFNDAPDIVDHSLPPQPGNGFLMRRGYTVVWCGWQADVPPTPGLMGLHVPGSAGFEGPVAGQNPESVSGQRTDTHAHALRPRTHAAPRRRRQRGRSIVAGARPSQRTGQRNPARRVVLRAGGRRRGAKLRAPARRFRAGTHLPTGVHDTRQSDCWARLCRGARHRLVPQARQRGRRQPVRRAAGLRLRLRRLAERPLPAPDALSRPGGGRGRTAGAGRRHPARGGRHARRVQPALRPAVQGRVLHHPGTVSLHRHAAVRPADRPARGACSKNPRRAARCPR